MVTLLQVLWVALCVVGHVIFGGECRCARNRVLAGTSTDEEFARSEMCMYPGTVYYHHPPASAFCNITYQQAQGIGCSCVEPSMRTAQLQHYDCLLADDCASRFDLPDNSIPIEDFMVGSAIGSAIGIFIGIWGFVMIHNFSGKGIKACAQLPLPAAGGTLRAVGSTD